VLEEVVRKVIEARCSGINFLAYSRELEGVIRGIGSLVKSLTK